MQKEKHLFGVWISHFCSKAELLITSVILCGLFFWTNDFSDLRICVVSIWLSVLNLVISIYFMTFFSPTPTVPTQNHPNDWFNALSLCFDYHLSPRCCCMLSKCSIICSNLPTQLWYWPHQLRIYFSLQLVTSLQCSLFTGHCMFYGPWHSQLSEHDLLVLRAISPGSA